MSPKEKAKKIFTDALNSSLPKNFMPEYCKLDGSILTIDSQNYNLDLYRKIYIFGSGKAAFTMAQEIENILGQKIYKGLVITPDASVKLQYIKVIEGSHPVPTQKSIEAAKELFAMMQGCEDEDLYIYLLSGGSSSLMELPKEPITLQELQIATSLMLDNGLDIMQINSVRKHLSNIKGGLLAQSCKASGIVLVLSDVIDNDLYSIGSAPLYADKSSFYDAKQVLEETNVFHKMPQSIQNVLDEGIKSLLQETPKRALERVKHYILSSNAHALVAAKQSAENLGLHVEISKEPMLGDVRVMVEKMYQEFKQSDVECLLFGGECTVHVRGNGKGGRNQHAAALILQNLCKNDASFTFLSAGTDGIDGSSHAAGGIVDTACCVKVREEKIDIESFIQNSDSFHLLERIDALVMTGASGTNVADIAILIKEY